MTKDRLIVALDIPDPDEALGMVIKLRGFVSFYKIGHILHLRAGIDFCQRLVSLNKKVFLDLKLYDIPEVVGRTVRAITEVGIHFTTVHGTKENVEVAIRSRGSGVTKILAVSALTSAEELSPGRLGRMAQMKCDGVVVSPHEAKRMKIAMSEEAIIVTPGIRLEGDKTHDHKRASGPAEAIRNGADYLVVGRPIIGSSDPLRAAQRYIEAIEQGCG